MVINKVISYKNAWDSLNQNYQEEFQEILEGLDELISVYLNPDTKKAGSFSLRELWDKIMEKRGWSVFRRTYRSESGQRILIGNIGPVKNQVSVALTTGFADHLNRWVFQQTTLAGRFGISRIPILVVPVNEFGRRIDDRLLARNSFEMYQREIQPITPLSHAYPFLILGYTDQSQIFNPEIIELESDPLITGGNVIIDRCIEFPPEYYQAGLNILNFFGTYIREQYPDEDANVKIEQNGKIVRLIIETQNGEREIIEKALEEYQLVISGRRQPEEVTKNEKLVLELKSELRLAKYRIETQQDIISFQQRQIDNFFVIVGQGLNNKNPISIDFKPVISLTNYTYVNENVSSALALVNELKELLPSASKENLELNDLEESLATIEKQENKETVKSSTAMSKLKKFIEKVSDGSEQVSKLIKATETSWDIFKNLAGKYNSIAEWCGLPQVPSIFTK